MGLSGIYSGWFPDCRGDDHLSAASRGSPWWVAGVTAGLAAGLAAILIAATAARGEDDGFRAATRKPQLRSPTVNAARAIGEDEVEGPTIFEGIKALNPIDAVRDDLRDDHGVYLHGVYLGDPYGNLGGGLKRGTTFSGRLDVELDVNMEKAAGLGGGAFHANMFEIHGHDLSANDIGNFLSINDIAAFPTALLYELWYEQKFGDKLAVRVGQQGIDVEFLTSNYAANFINATFGWPGLPSVDLPAGGPAYPLATPAIRVKFDPMDNVSILAAVFNGDPAGPCPGDPQTCDQSGLNFRVTDPPLAIAEAHLRYGTGKTTGILPGTIKLGAFGHFGRFDDQRFASNGLPLASAVAGSSPLSHTPNGGFYGVIDQQVYRVPGDDPEQGVGLFFRAIGAPADRNLVDLYLDAGVSSLGLIPGRPRDSFGIAAAFAKISSAAAAADIEMNLASGIAGPVRDFEAVVELTYQAEIVLGLAIQPTFQYIAHPGGNIAKPYGDGMQPIRDAKVFGATTVVRF